MSPAKVRDSSLLHQWNPLISSSCPIRCFAWPRSGPLQTKSMDSESIYITKNRGTPKWMVYIWFILETLLKWMIWGGNFRKHPYKYSHLHSIHLPSWDLTYPLFFSTLLSRWFSELSVGYVILFPGEYHTDSLMRTPQNPMISCTASFFGFLASPLFCDIPVGSIYYLQLLINIIQM